MSGKTVEIVEVGTAADLLTWLGKFSANDLHALYLLNRDGDDLTLRYETVTLSDGSEVFNLVAS